MTSSFTVATYNVLAEAHIRPEWFPLVNPAHFVTATRYPRVVERVIGLNADILCLQEVDDLLFRKLKAVLEFLDYRGIHTKYDGKPDGVATFMRWPFWKAFTPKVLRYDDASLNGGKQSGRLAHVIRMGVDGAVTVANCHLKWDPPNSPNESRLGLEQAHQLIGTMLNLPGPHIICGDTNALPEDAILEAFNVHGFSDAHEASTMTFNSSDTVGGARKLDYILHSSGLVSEASPAVKVIGTTPLPSDTEPSDHIPLVAKLTFAD